MGLNIKRPQAEEAIRELAAHDGISLTDAVETAVREALASRRGSADIAKRRRKIEELMAYLDRQAPGPPLPHDARSNHDMLYGPDGLPA